MNGYPDTPAPTVPVKPKWIVTTKTFLFFAFTLAAALLGYVQEILPILATVVDIPERWPAWVVVLVSIVGIGLRRISDQPARFRPADRAIRVERAESSRLDPLRARPG